jgi:hypothetical protein
MDEEKSQITSSWGKGYDRFCIMRYSGRKEYDNKARESLR